MIVRYKKLTTTAIAPANVEAREPLSWYLYADEEMLLYPLKPAYVKTGISLEIEDIYAVPVGALLHPPQSLYKDGIIVLGNTLMAEEQLQQEIVVPLIYIADIFTNGPYKIVPGDAVAKFVLSPYEELKFEEIQMIGQLER